MRFKYRQRKSATRRTCLWLLNPKEELKVTYLVEGERGEEGGGEGEGKITGKIVSRAREARGNGVEGKGGNNTAELGLGEGTIGDIGVDAPEPSEIDGTEGRSLARYPVEEVEERAVGVENILRCVE